MKLELLTRKPDHSTHTTPILFVHGAWHAAWCWDEYFLPYFVAQGWTCYALSLCGHGNSEGRVRWASGADYVADVTQAVEMIGTNPIVIGHSMGGYVVQKYLEKHDTPAGVLLASVPSSGILLFTLRKLIRHPVDLFRMLVTFDPYKLVDTPEKTRDAFFSDDMPQESVEQYFRRIQSESYRMLYDMLLLNLPRPRRVKTPLLVLSAENDRIFSVPEQQATARAYDAENEIFPNMAHDMMLENNWQQVADAIITWLKGRGL
jgi:pimeloyl-ACP methyl ester carboxylesterase